MAESLAFSHGLTLSSLDESEIDGFVDNLSEANKREFREVYQLEPKAAILSFFHAADILAVRRNGRVVALCGFHTYDHTVNFWSLFSKDMEKMFVRFVRASPSLIEYFGGYGNSFACEIWSENDMIMQWLGMLGFTPLSERELNEHKLITFVRCDVPDFYGMNHSQRPVTH